MLWALLFTIIFGSNDLFVINNINKYTRKHVTDKERAAEIKEIRKEHKTIRKAFQKSGGEYIKRLSSLLLNKETSEEDFISLFEEEMKVRKDYQDHELQIRLKTRKALKKEEWDAIIDDAKKDFAKYSKYVKTNKEKTDKHVQELHDKILLIQNAEHRMHALTFYFEQITQYEKLIEDYYNFYFPRNKTLLDYDLTVEEWEEMQIELNDKRLKIYRLLVEAHSSLQPHTTDQEWKFISRQLRRLVK